MRQIISCQPQLQRTKILDPSRNKEGFWSPPKQVPRPAPSQDLYCSRKTCSRERRKKRTKKKQRGLSSPPKNFPDLLPPKTLPRLCCYSRKACSGEGKEEEDNNDSVIFGSKIIKFNFKQYALQYNIAKTTTNSQKSNNLYTWPFCMHTNNTVSPYSDVRLLYCHEMLQYLALSKCTISFQT